MWILVVEDERKVANFIRQGLASAVWVQRSDGVRLVFIDIDGEPLVADAIQDVGRLGDGTSPAPAGPARFGPGESGTAAAVDQPWRSSS